MFQVVTYISICDSQCLLYSTGMAIEAAERTIQDSLDQFHNPKHTSTTCTAGTHIFGVLAAHTSKHSYLVKRTGTVLLRRYYEQHE